MLAWILAGCLAFWTGERFYRSARAMMGFHQAPVRFTLRELERQPSWSRRFWVTRSRRRLEELGFRHFANYCIEEVPYYYLAAFVDRQGVAAVIYDTPVIKGWVDLFARHGARGGLTVSSSTFVGLVSTPEWAVRVATTPGSDIESILAAFRKASDAIPSAQWIPMTPENFVSMFQEYFADETDWRNSRGGMSREEVSALNRGRLQGTALDRQWREQREKAFACFEEGMRRRLSAQLPELEVRSSAELLSVHSRLEMDWLQQRLAEHSEKPQGEPVILPADCTTRSAAEAFHWIQDQLPIERRYRYLGQVDFPEPTYVYQKPEAGIPFEILR